MLSDCFFFTEIVLYLTAVKQSRFFGFTLIKAEVIALVFKGKEIVIGFVIFRCADKRHCSVHFQLVFRICRNLKLLRAGYAFPELRNQLRIRKFKYKLIASDGKLLAR